MTKLELNVGDFVELRNGQRVGPLKEGYTEGGFAVDQLIGLSHFTGMWLNDGTEDFFLTSKEPRYDIVKVIPPLTKGLPPFKPSNQHKAILKHLRTAGSITVREAMVEYSISSLTKRISELREAGYNIESNKKHHPVTGQRYVRYTLEQEQC